MSDQDLTTFVNGVVSIIVEVTLEAQQKKVSEDSIKKFSEATLTYLTRALALMAPLEKVQEVLKETQSSIRQKVVLRSPFDGGHVHQVIRLVNSFFFATNFVRHYNLPHSPKQEEEVAETLADSILSLLQMFYSLDEVQVILGTLASAFGITKSRFD